MQVHHVGYGVRGFYRIARLGHLWEMTPKDAQRRLTILGFWGRHGLCGSGLGVFRRERKNKPRRLAPIGGGVFVAFVLAAPSARSRRGETTRSEPARRRRDSNLRNRMCVIDGQGGGIGAALIKALREAFPDTVELVALGTNAIATFNMMKAGANRGAAGENAIVRTAPTARAILGPLSVTWANAMLGEVTARMAEAIVSSPAQKILLPLFQEGVVLAGVEKEPLPHLVQAAVEAAREVLRDV